MEWSRIDETGPPVANHHHCIFWSENDEKIMTFGGYAHYEYFNEFKSYDFSSNAWSRIEMSGDTIYPRTHTVIGNDDESGLFYVFGGFGNENGSQALGGRTFFDLYSVDLSDKKTNKLLDYQESDLDFVPRGQLIVDNGGKDFYTLGSKMKSYKKAHDEFELFKKRYFKTYNDQYAGTFDEIVNLQPNLDRLV